MDTKPVIEFLGNVPLLQRLPSSSLKRIAEVVAFKSYERGEFVVREGEVGDGVYFVWEGEAEVSPSMEEEDSTEFQLKQYDYFGIAMSSYVHPADVVALTKLTCVVLPHENCSLLKSKSIWNADKALDRCSLMESILHLKPIDLNKFEGITLPDAPQFGRVFGGQFIGQALAAASKTVDCHKIVHSLHANFLLVGNSSIPIIYQVCRLRDGNSFATRRVDAIQKGNIVFSLIASFQKDEEGFEHQMPIAPAVPDPDMLLSLEEILERRLTNPALPRSYRNKVAAKNSVPWPIELRFCEPSNDTSQTKSHPSLKYWFRAKEKLSDDQALHRFVVAYASDLMFATISLNPHRRKGMRPLSLSLDHSIWFHRSVKADDWLLYVIDSPIAHSGRGFASAQMFNRKGELVVSLTQEAVTREGRTQKPSTKSKL